VNSTRAGTVARGYCSTAALSPLDPNDVHNTFFAVSILGEF
jgi:hypothetical protein